MRWRKVYASALLAVTCVAAQDGGEDSYLAQSVRVVSDRVAAIVRLDRPPAVVAVRTDESARELVTRSIAQRILPVTRAAARGRAWRDLGLGSGTAPAELVAAIVLDLPGMSLSPSPERLLVDPERLLPQAGRGDPVADPAAAILLATGVAPDEPLAGHYLAHAFLDGPGSDDPITTDALLARQALAEGAANLAAFAFLFEGVGLESEVLSGALRPEEVLGGQLVPESLRSSSPVVSHMLEFVYLDGFAQSAAIARKGGFGRLAQERRSRRTTRDVLHLDRPATPPGDFSEPSLPPSWGLSVVDRDSLGEQGVISMVSLLTGKDNLGLIAADGWVADGLWRFEPSTSSKAGPDDGATVWTTRWKTEEDSADFAYALERCLQARFPGENLVSDATPGTKLLRRPDRVYRIDRAGVGVVFQVVTPSNDAKNAPDGKKKGPSPQPKPAQK